MSLNDDKLEIKYINLKKKENNKTKLCKHNNCKKKTCNYSHSTFEQKKTTNSVFFDICIETNIYIDIVKKIIKKFKKFYIENENNYRGIMLPSITLDNWIVNNTNYNIKNIDSLKDISYFGIVNVILYFHFPQKEFFFTNPLYILSAANSGVFKKGILKVFLSVIGVFTKPGVIKETLTPYLLKSKKRLSAKLLSDAFDGP